MSTQHLSAPRRRTRKEQLARRHGWRCTYCRCPFTTLREATLDHIVPVSLYRTWAAVNLTLACRPCNHAKADRLPLSMALLLVWAQGRDQRDETRHTRRHAPRHTDRPTGHQVERVDEVDEVDVPPVDGVDVHGVHPVFTAPGGVFIPLAEEAAGPVGRGGSRLVGSGGSRVDDRSVSPLSTPVDWRLLARLAHAHHTATRTPRTPIRTPPAAPRAVTRTATRSPERSGCDLPVRHARTATRTATPRRSGDGRTTA
ncbi:HNH endonuclease signature motif containing protein [Streptomyces sp. P8-A8]|uniref:HNH endonuclease n=1 Tax=Streptomyces sp. P8-A8 TaxID=3029759 RepID=UPI0036DC480A